VMAEAFSLQPSKIDIPDRRYPSYLEMWADSNV
jgi:hypothetical protein